MFLSALYTIFAVLLFLCHAGEEKSILRMSADGVHMHDAASGVEFVSTATNKTPLVGVVTPTPGVVTPGVMGGDPVHHHHSHTSAGTTSALGATDGFITMDNSSQGTSE